MVVAGQVCPLCDRAIAPGEHVAFQHGTLLHLHCYSLARLAKSDKEPRRVWCAVCHKPLVAATDTVVDKDGLVVRARCAVEGPTETVRPIAGSASSSPWTALFHEHIAAHASVDPRAHRELIAICREVRAESASLREHARVARERTARLVLAL